MLSIDVFRFPCNGIDKDTPIFLEFKNHIENETTIKSQKLPECTPEKAYDMIYYNLLGVQNASNGKDVLPEFKIEEDNMTLRERIGAK